MTRTLNLVRICQVPNFVLVAVGILIHSQSVDASCKPCVKILNDVCCERPEKIWRDDPGKKICCDFSRKNSTGSVLTNSVYEHIQCESHVAQYKQCPARGKFEEMIRIARILPGSGQCLLGVNYGATPDKLKVWVRGGCKAVITVNLNICHPNPCKHGGTCKKKPFATTSPFKCTCPEGFKGERCQKVPEGSCVNTAGDRADMYGNGCNFYQTNIQHCGEFDGNGFLAGTMCCACGGGREDCKDISPNCGVQANENKCRTNDYIQERCKKSCRLCAINCPVGYHYQTGDKVGHATQIENKKANGIEECGKRCNNNNQCSSIEWSDSEKFCILLTAKYTDGPKWRDYRFCSKVKGSCLDSRLANVKSRAEMIDAGWKLWVKYGKWNDENYVSQCGSSTFWGYNYDKRVGKVKATFRGSGTAILSFGQCYKGSGVTKVYLNNTKIRSAAKKDGEVTVEFDYNPGDTLMLKEVNTGIIKIYSLLLTCKAL